MPGLANLDVYQGDDFIATITVLSTDGTAADLTGYTAQSQIRIGPADSSPQVSAVFQCTINSNNITIVLPHTVTLTLTKPSYVWDLQITDASNWNTTLLAGAVNVTKDVTRGTSSSVRIPIELGKKMAAR
jgi:hypothetical protein